MPANKAIVKIETKYNKKGIDQAKKGMLGLKKSTVDMAKNIVGPLAIGAIIATTIKLGKEFSDLAAAAEEIQSKFDVVFGAASDSVQSWANDYSDSVGRSESDTLEFLGSMKDLLTPMGFVEDSARELSKKIVTLANDIGSFNDKPTADVIRDIQSAMTGGGETVKKYGVIVNVATIKQEALTSGIWDGKSALDAQVKAQAAYQLIAKGSAAATGDLLRTQGSATNTSIRLEAAQKDLGIALGVVINQGLTPMKAVLADVTKGFADLISNANDANTLMKNLRDGGDVSSASMQSLKDSLARVNAELAAGAALGVNKNLKNEKLMLEGLIAAYDTKDLFIIKSIDSARVLNQVETDAAAKRIAILNIEKEAGKKLEELRFSNLDQNEQQIELLQQQIDYWAILRTKGADVQNVINQLVSDRNELQKTGIDVEKEMIDTVITLSDVQKLKNDIVIAGLDYEIEKVEEVKNSYEDLASAGLGAFVTAFKDVGEGNKTLMEGLKDGAKDAISAILEMYAQLWLAQAIAAAASLNVPSAVAYTAAAATAYAASGLVQSFATGGSFVTSGATPILVGDNASGQERVTVEPVGGNNSGGGTMILNIDGAQFTGWIQNKLDNGGIRIPRRIIV